MAVNLNPSIKNKVQPLFAQPDQFRRNRARIKTSKMYRKVKLKFGHIFLSFILLGFFFVGLQQGYLYLITCDELTVETVEIECRNPHIQADIRGLIQGRNLGNILLLDMHKLKEAVSAHPRIKDAQIRKLFPSSLRISITERIPAAVVKQQNYKLIDRDGVVLEESNSRLWLDFPLLTDSRNFQGGEEKKLNLAWTCIDDLDPALQAQIDILDFSRFNAVTVKLRGHQVPLILGNSDFARKIQTYLDNQNLFSQYGELKTIDLRFGDRFILTPRNYSADVQHSGIRKEES